MLETNIDKVLAGRNRVRFFFPLCGKAVDMKWYERDVYKKKKDIHDINVATSAAIVTSIQ